LGKQFSDSVIVAQGLNKGEKIVVEGVQNLHDGSTVTTAAPQPVAGKK
jgi:membrane fusion protein (multidrug efflux system)